MAHKNHYQINLTNPGASVAATVRKIFSNMPVADFGLGSHSLRGQIGQGTAMNIAITTDAVSGTTPTSDVTMDTSWDNGVTWTEIVTGTQVTTSDGVELEVETTRYSPMLSLKIVTGGTAPVYNYVIDIIEHFD